MRSPRWFRDSKTPKALDTRADRDNTSYVCSLPGARFRKGAAAMMKPKSNSDTPKRSSSPAHLTGKVEKRLRAYALAAGASGVGLLALTMPAEAKVIYTPVDTTLTDGTLPIALDNGRKANFILADRFFSNVGQDAWRQRLAVGGSAGASIIVSNNSAGALASGSIIGSSRAFRNVHGPKEVMAIAKSWFYGSSFYGNKAYGNWANVTDRFLGLKFALDGETHYGWARLNVTASFDRNGPYITATLTGYAFETVANQSIKAGQTSGTDLSMTAPENLSPGSLGALALGSPGGAH